MSGLRKKEKGSFAGSDDTTVMASTPIGARLEHQTCSACGGTGVRSQRRVKDANSWHLREEPRTVQDPECWPLRSLNAQNTTHVSRSQDA